MRRRRDTATAAARASSRAAVMPAQVAVAARRWCATCSSKTSRSVGHAKAAPKPRRAATRAAIRQSGSASPGGGDDRGAAARRAARCWSSCRTSRPSRPRAAAGRRSARCRCRRRRPARTTSGVRCERAPHARLVGQRDRAGWSRRSRARRVRRPPRARRARPPCGPAPARAAAQPHSASTSRAIALAREVAGAPAAASPSRRSRDRPSRSAGRSARTGPAPGRPIWPVARCRFVIALTVSVPCALWLTPIAQSESAARAALQSSATRAKVSRATPHSRATRSAAKPRARTRAPRSPRCAPASTPRRADPLAHSSRQHGRSGSVASLPGRSATCRSATSAVAVRRGSSTTSARPRPARGARALDALEQHRMTPRHVGADDEEEVGGFEVVVAGGRAVHAEGALVARRPRSTCTAASSSRRGWCRGSPCASLWKRVVVLGQQLAREVEADRIGSARGARSARRDAVRARRPTRRASRAAALRRAQRAGWRETVRHVHRLVQREALRAERAAIRRVLRVAAHADQPIALARDEHAAADAAEAAHRARLAQPRSRGAPVFGRMLLLLEERRAAARAARSSPGARARRRARAAARTATSNDRARAARADPSSSARCDRRGRAPRPRRG